MVSLIVCDIDFAEIFSTRDISERNVHITDGSFFALNQKLDSVYLRKLFVGNIDDISIQSALHLDFSEIFRIIEVVYGKFRKLRIARNAHFYNEIIHTRKIRRHGEFNRKRAYNPPRTATERCVEHAVRIRIDDFPRGITFGFSSDVYLIGYKR